MNTFTEYHLDPDRYEFLNIFREKWVKIREDYLTFIRDKTINLDLISQVMTPRSKTITTKTANTYQGFGLLFNGKKFLQVIEEYQLHWPNLSNKEIKRSLTDIYKNHFQTTFACISQADLLSNNGIRNVYFSIFKPGLNIKCHINYNPHIYRGYLGLIVPKGDIAMKICGEKLSWREGEIMVLDHTFPHCPHNRTTESRVALIIDFYQPDKVRNQMVALEKSLMDERMKSNPYGFGVFGDDDVVSEDDLKKYGFDHQITWSNNLL